MGQSILALDLRDSEQVPLCRDCTSEGPDTPVLRYIFVIHMQWQEFVYTKGLQEGEMGCRYLGMLY